MRKGGVLNWQKWNIRIGDVIGQCFGHGGQARSQHEMAVQATYLPTYQLAQSVLLSWEEWAEREWGRLRGHDQIVDRLLREERAALFGLTDSEPIYVRCPSKAYFDSAQESWCKNGPGCFQSCKMIHLGCLNPPMLWSFVTAAIGN